MTENWKRGCSQRPSTAEVIEGRWVEEQRMRGWRNEEWRIRVEPPFRALPGAGVD